MPPNLQVTKLHKRLKLRPQLLVSFGDFVFWWQKNSFRSGLKDSEPMRKALQFIMQNFQKQIQVKDLIEVTDM
jgi:hypothetical protein